MRINTIAAIKYSPVQDKYIIGKDGGIPWHSKEDLQRFRKITTGHAVVMGRKTYESIGKSLPGRDNIIITRQKDYKVENAYVVHSLKDALVVARSIPDKVQTDCFIIGGEEIYRRVYPLVDRMYITEFSEPTDVEGDTFFPPFYYEDFRFTYIERHCDYIFTIFSKEPMDIL
jgi:dihydrofolate reductase